MIFSSLESECIGSLVRTCAVSKFTGIDCPLETFPRFWLKSYKNYFNFIRKIWNLCGMQITRSLLHYNFVISRNRLLRGRVAEKKEFRFHCAMPDELTDSIFYGDHFVNWDVCSFYIFYFVLVSLPYNVLWQCFVFPEFFQFKMVFLRHMYIQPPHHPPCNRGNCIRR